MLLQLQQVLSAGQSAQMPVKNHQQRMPGEIFKAMRPAVRVDELEWQSGQAFEPLPFGSTLHGTDSPVMSPLAQEQLASRVWPDRDLITTLSFQ